MRKLVWFSCGAASAVALMLAQRKYGKVEAVYCDTGGEHPDNARFMRDVESWLGLTVTVLKNEKYADHFDLFQKHGFIIGPHNSPCTVELKKVPRFGFQRPDDVQIFGYTLEEQERARRFTERFPEANAEYPLIENGIDKASCLGILWRSGIKIPVMYDMGYDHNNCIGCVKGGMGYWNKIRKDFPEQFNRMARIEREIGATVLRDEGEPLYLDELAPDRGQYPRPSVVSCDFACEAAL